MLVLGQALRAEHRSLHSNVSVTTSRNCTLPFSLRREADDFINILLQIDTNSIEIYDYF